MILSFGDDATADIYHGRTTHRARRFPSVIVRTALRKLDMLNAADRVKYLRQPLGNRLEALKGNFEGYHSNRVNEQWRIIFQWKDSNAYRVSIVDYH
jgi:toxin HigB-1